MLKKSKINAYRRVWVAKLDGGPKDLVETQLEEGFLLGKLDLLNKEH